MRNDAAEPTLADWLNGVPTEPAAPAPPVPADYAAIDAMNWSTLRHLATSAKLLRWRVDHPREDTDALELGRAAHCAILEPARWAESYVARPDFGDGRTKEAKAGKTAWLATLAPGVEVLDADEHALVERMARAVREHPEAARLLHAGRAEEIVTWTDAATGLACKARVDFIAPGYVVDIKSTRRDTVRSITHDVATLLYYGQLAFYHDGARAAGLIPDDADGPFAIFAQKGEPFDVVPARLGLEAIERGRNLYRSLLDRYLACRAANWWPGIAPEVITLQLPPWAAGGDGEEQEW